MSFLPFGAKWILIFFAPSIFNFISNDQINYSIYSIICAG